MFCFCFARSVAPSQQRSLSSLTHFRFSDQFRFSLCPIVITRARANILTLHCERTGYRMANRTICRLAQWCSRVFVVEINQKSEPIYFALSSTPSARNKELDELFGSGKLLSVCALGNDRIQSAHSYAHLKRALSENLPPGCELLDSASFLPGVKNSLVKGFFLRDNSASSFAERVLTQQKDSVCVFTYTPEENGWYLCSPVTDEASEHKGKYYVTPAPAPLHHPSTLNIINSDVFYQMKDAYNVLQEVIVSYWLISLKPV